MKKIMVIFGTRPEAIKMAPLVKQLEADESLEPIVVVTAQHREMLDQVLEVFEIKPDYDLNLMKKNQTLSTVTSGVLLGLEDIIKEVEPDMVLVHGDTTTTFAGALTAFYQQVDVGHVEAGLRTYQKYAPYPEELNRQMTTKLADIHFAPTELSESNLLKECVKEDTIYVTGNTAIDALNTTVSDEYISSIIQRHEGKRVVLLTAHRRENIGAPMANIFKAIHDIVENFEDVVVIYPMHRNQKVRDLANEYLTHERIELIEPLDVIDFHNFAAQSYLILTDSGGVQEEAPSLGKPVLVLRDVTERPEGVEAGTLKIVGTEKNNVFEETKLLLENQNEYERMSQANNPYGDGQASRRICEAIKHFYKIKENVPERFK